MSGAAGDEGTPVYAVRFSVQAQQDVIDAAFRLAEITQEPTLAQQWAEGLYREVGRLATNPRVYAVTERETRLFGRETRQMLYRRSSSSVAYRVLFTIREAAEEGPTIIVIHVRHGGRRPPTRDEAHRLLANQ